MLGMISKPEAPFIVQQNLLWNIQYSNKTEDQRKKTKFLFDLPILSIISKPILTDVCSLRLKETSCKESEIKLQRFTSLQNGDVYFMKKNIERDTMKSWR